jgi:hypothetical protein
MRLTSLISARKSLKIDRPACLEGKVMISFKFTILKKNGLTPGY